MKLEEILGEELFAQVNHAIEEHNAKEPDKLKHVRYADLSEGGYVSKDKYFALETDAAGKADELVKANDLIAELKKATKGDEGIQGKVAAYETQVTDLQAQLQETKLKSAVKVALLSEKAADVDYLTFKLNEKLKEKDESLELDENDNIKGWEDKLAGLKTQFPSMFETASGSDKKIVAPNKLPDSNGKDILTKSDLLKKPYAERNRIYEENPEGYQAAMKS